jgi:hypothetical protein
MKVLIVLAVVTGLLLVYALWGREWLKSKPWAEGFFAWVEPIEITLFKKSETILFARLLSGLGGVLTILTQLGSIDISPILPLVPDKYAGIVQTVYGFLPLLITGVGAIVEWLRNRTTKPIELVAVAEKDITPAVATAIAVAEVAKVDAVAEVKAEQKVAA